MDPTIAAALITAIATPIATLAGVYFGHRWSEDAAKSREQRVAQERSRAVRTILSIEIEQNFATLRKFLDVLRLFSDTRPPPIVIAEVDRSDVQGFQLEFAYKAWESQIPTVAQALDAETVGRVHLLYTKMERLQELAATQPRIAGDTKLYEQFMQIAQEVLDMDNPLQPHWGRSRE